MTLTPAPDDFGLPCEQQKICRALHAASPQKLTKLSSPIDAQEGHT